MPMKTTLSTRPAPPGTRPRSNTRAAATTCSTISAVDRLRRRPPWPVAQNGHPMPQPAWLDTHTVVRDVDCDGGTTRKTLWRGFDGVLVESVLMRYPDRTTVCVSSQAGCGMGCPFCATGQGGLRRG